MTKSSGQAFGPDSHYNEKLWQHVMWKSIEVRRILEGISECSLGTAYHSIEVKCYSALIISDYLVGIGMVGKDKYTSISVDMWGPATTDFARQSYTAIVPKYQDLFCADHDFSTIDKLLQLSMRILIHQNISSTRFALDNRGVLDYVWRFIVPLYVSQTSFSTTMPS